MTKFHIIGFAILIGGAILAFLHAYAHRCEPCGNWRTDVVRVPRFGGGLVTKIECPRCGEWRRIESDATGNTVAVRRSYDFKRKFVRA